MNLERNRQYKFRTVVFEVPSLVGEHVNQYVLWGANVLI